MCLLTALSTEPSRVQPSEDEILESCQVVHCGQVLPIEDVEEVIDKLLVKREGITCSSG